MINKIRQLFGNSIILIFTAFITLLLFTGNQTNILKAPKAFAQVPSMVCLGNCPTITTIPAAAAAQTQTSTTPSSGGSTPAATAAPTAACQPAVTHSIDNTDDSQHSNRPRRWRRGNGGGSQGIIQFLLQLLQQLFQLIQQILSISGGTTTTTTTAPTATTNNTTNPTATVSLPPCPTAQTTAQPTSTTTTTTNPTQSGPTPTGTVSTTSGPTSAAQPVAVVFRGPATSCCADAMASMLQADTKQNFKIIYAGGSGDPNVETALATPGVKLYAQPGGDGNSYATAYQQGFASDPGAKAAIQNFVNSGGRYIGICMGAWFTASDAFDLIPGSIENWPTTAGAEITDATADVIVNINWRGTLRKMFYQGGPNMILNSGVNSTVLGTFNNAKVATVVYSYGSGKVGLSGPHPEATSDWYSANGLTNPGSTQDLGNDFIDTLMQ